jgi:DNA-binding IclR family transcriptional regulator
MPGLIQSIERSAELLRLIGDYPATLGLSEIATTLDLPKPTAHGLLQTLKAVGFVDQVDPGSKYVLASSLLNIGNERLDPNELRSHCLNWADSLASHCGQTVHVAMWQDRIPTIVHHVFRPDDSLQHLHVGMRMPAHATAVGKTLLAWSPAPARLAGATLDRFTQHTITSSRLLVRSLVSVREQGWAEDVEDTKRVTPRSRHPSGEPAAGWWQRWA